MYEQQPAEYIANNVISVIRSIFTCNSMKPSMSNMGYSDLYYGRNAFDNIYYNVESDTVYFICIYLGILNPFI